MSSATEGVMGVRSILYSVVNTSRIVIPLGLETGTRRRRLAGTSIYILWIAGVVAASSNVDKVYDCLGLKIRVDGGFAKQ